MRRYKVNVMQKREHPDFWGHLSDVFRTIDNCIEIVSPSTMKSIRQLPEPGIKWIGGVIEVNEQCIKGVQEMIINRSHEFFNIRLKRIYN